MKQKIAALIGASGLIGEQILTLLIQDDFYQEIIIINRRELNFNHPKVKEIIINFEDELAFRESLRGVHHLFCAIGTTSKKVKGDKIAYRKIDYAIPVNAAKYCLELGVSHFSLVSSVGANDKNSNFYLKLKGEVERDLSLLAIPSISIYRPSMLLGNRKEFRLGELISKKIFQPLSFLVPSNYKPIQASAVAKAMVENAKLESLGIKISYYSDMMKCSK